MIIDTNMKLESLISLGDACKLLRKYDEALRFYKKSLEYCKIFIFNNNYKIPDLNKNSIKTKIITKLDYANSLRLK